MCLFTLIRLSQCEVGEIKAQLEEYEVLFVSLEHRLVSPVFGKV